MATMFQSKCFRVETSSTYLQAIRSQDMRPEGVLQLLVSTTVFLVSKDGTVVMYQRYIDERLREREYSMNPFFEIGRNLRRGLRS